MGAVVCGAVNDLGDAEVGGDGEDAVCVLEREFGPDFREPCEHAVAGEGGGGVEGSIVFESDEVRWIPVCPLVWPPRYPKKRRKKQESREETADVATYKSQAILCFRSRGTQLKASLQKVRGKTVLRGFFLLYFWQGGGKPSDKRQPRLEPRRLRCGTTFLSSRR